MNRNYKLSQQFVIRILFISFFLQSCSDSINLPNQGEQLEAEQEKGRMEIVNREAEEATELGKFEVFPMELVQEILSIVPYPAILAVSQVNRTFYQLTTGYDQPGLVGVENRPSQSINTDAWSINKEIDFGGNKLSKLTPETIPSFPFYQLMGKVKNLSKEFWPYLQESSVHTLHLNHNQISAEGATQLVQHLQGSSVHTLDLSWNQIGDATQQLLKEEYPHINWIF